MVYRMSQPKGEPLAKLRETVRKQKEVIVIGRLVGACACAIVLVSSCAASAFAGQIVYSHGSGEIWSMNEDGSGARPIVQLAQVPSMNEILEPQVFANNGRAVAFVGYTTANRNAHNTCGFWCKGLYVDAGGSVSRVSPAATGCESCETDVYDPRWTAGGQILDNKYSYAFGQEFGSWIPIFAEHEYFAVPDAPSSDGVKRPVEHLAPANASRGFGPTAAAVPDPQNPAKIAYIGAQCQTVGCTPETRLWTSTEGGGTDTWLVADDELVEVAWSPDGTHFADVEGGGERGIWTYESELPIKEAYWVLEDPIQSGEPYVTTFRDPAWIGSSRIAFTADHNIWSIPASCGKGGTPCKFPQDATQLTFDGTESQADASPSWTSSTQSLAVETKLPTTPPTSTPAGTPSGPTAAALSGMASVQSVVVKHGIVDVRVTCAGSSGSHCVDSAQLIVVETLRGSHVVAVAARHKKPRKRTVVVGSSSATLAGGQATTLTIGLNVVGKALLKSFKTLPVGVRIEQALNGAPKLIAEHSLTIRAPKHHH
jgi:hypothetical protein